MSIKVQEGRCRQLAQHGLIKLILEDSLHNLIIPIAWSKFAHMQEEGEIRAIEYEKIPTFSEEEEETEDEKEEEKKDEEEEEKEDEE